MSKRNHPILGKKNPRIINVPNAPNDAPLCHGGQKSVYFEKKKKVAISPHSIYHLKAKMQGYV